MASMQMLPMELAGGLHFKTPKPPRPSETRVVEHPLAFGSIGAVLPLALWTYLILLEEYLDISRFFSGPGTFCF